jgi:hypothetical protein
MELISENRRGKGKKNASTQARRSSRRAGRNDALLTTVVSNSCFHHSLDIDSTERLLSDYIYSIAVLRALFVAILNHWKQRSIADRPTSHGFTLVPRINCSPIRGVRRQICPQNKQLSEVQAARRFCMDLPNNINLDDGLREK